MLDSIAWANEKLALHGLSEKYCIVFGGPGAYLLDASGASIAFEACNVRNVRRAVVLLLMRVQLL